MLLDTLTPSILSIVQYSGKVYHLSTGGVTMFSAALSKLAEVTTTGDTIAVNDYGLYIGGTSGIYFISHASLGVGGDVTASVVLKFTTGTTPPIASNTVYALSGKGTALFVVTNTTLQYFPNSESSTVYNCTNNFGINKVSISVSQDFIALASDSKVYSLDIPTAAFSYNDVCEAAGITSVYVEPSITPPAALELSATYMHNWLYSGSNEYIVSMGISPEFIRCYNWNNGTPSKLTVDIQPTNASWTTLSVHPTLPVVLHWTQAGFAAIYSIVGTTLTRQTNIAAATTYGQDGAWSTDGTHYAIVAGGSVALLSYVSSVLTYHGTFTALTNASRVIWSSTNPDMCIIVAANSNQIAAYERVGNTLVHRNTLSVTTSCVYLSEDLGRIVAMGTGNVASVYEISGTSLVARGTVAKPTSDTPQPLSTQDGIQRRNGVSMYQLGNIYTWWVRALGGKVRFIPGQCGFTRGDDAWTQYAGTFTVKQDYSWVLVSVGSKVILYPIRVTKINPITATINAIAAGEDIYIGTSDGLVVRPRVRVERGFALMDHKRAIDSVAGLGGTNVTAVAVKGSPASAKGVMVYGHNTGSGSAGILDLGEIS